jgi:hypothetical protein
MVTVHEVVPLRLIAQVVHHAVHIVTVEASVGAVVLTKFQVQVQVYSAEVK